MKDAAGNERNEQEVEALARETLSQMGSSEIAHLLIELVGLAGLPDDITKCPCHGLWYDECEDYA